jgi:hypothetical protein
VEDPSAQRRRRVVECGDTKVRRHHGADAGVDRGAEGLQGGGGVAAGDG